MLKSIAEAQRANAALYRAWARRSPWNSKARAEWLRLAANAEAVAKGAA